MDLRSLGDLAMRHAQTGPVLSIRVIGNGTPIHLVGANPIRFVGSSDRELWRVIASEFTGARRGMRLEGLFAPLSKVDSSIGICGVRWTDGSRSVKEGEIIYLTGRKSL